MTTLLDANVVIALSVVDHVHHDVAEDWFVTLTDGYATCPSTQGSLLRFLLRGGASSTQAMSVILPLVSHERHEFWPDGIGYDDVDLRGVVGHRQVTDAYLASLARWRGGRVATLDRGLAALHPDVAVLVDPPA